jgi:hypothetical protein
LTHVKYVNEPSGPSNKKQQMSESIKWESAKPQETDFRWAAGDFRLTNNMLFTPTGSEFSLVTQKELNLFGFGIGDKGIELAIAPAIRARILQPFALRLANNSITTNGIKTLVQALKTNSSNSNREFHLTVSSNFLSI